MYITLGHGRYLAYKCSVCCCLYSTSQVYYVLFGFFFYLARNLSKYHISVILASSFAYVFALCSLLTGGTNILGRELNNCIGSYFLNHITCIK